MKIAFFGTPEIAVKSLQILTQKSDMEVVCVVTQPDRPSGRGHKLMPPPVKLAAQDLGLEIYQPTSIRKDKELIEKLKTLEIDYFVTFAFGQILSEEVLDIPKFSTINLHASLLPEYRGANPLQRAIVDGKTFTGVTTMLTVLELDAGDICLTQEIQISESMTTPELQGIVADISPEILYKTLKGLKSGDIKPRKQDGSMVTVASKFKKEDGQIDWTDCAKNIHNKIRGLLDWPCAYTFFQGKMLKLTASECAVNNLNLPPGSVIEVSKSGILVKSAKNAVLIKELKPESKPKMRAFDFANGAKIKPGDVFGGEQCCQEA